MSSVSSDESEKMIKLENDSYPATALSVVVGKGIKSMTSKLDGHNHLTVGPSNQPSAEKSTCGT